MMKDMNNKRKGMKIFCRIRIKIKFIISNVVISNITEEMYRKIYKKVRLTEIY